LENWVSGNTKKVGGGQGRSLRGAKQGGGTPKGGECARRNLGVRKK